MAIEIRKIQASDRLQWDELWNGYQRFYEVDLTSVTETLWQRLLDETDHTYPVGIVAAEGENLVGLAHYLFYRSTWSDKDRIYLHDLYTSPDERGKGIGRKLIEAIYEIANNNDCETVFWMTQETNTTARVLYDKLANKTPFVEYSRD